MVKLSVIQSFIPQGSSSIFEFATTINGGRAPSTVLKTPLLLRIITTFERGGNSYEEDDVTQKVTTVTFTEGKHCHEVYSIPERYFYKLIH
jgi:hypothetical protein